MLRFYVNRQNRHTRIIGSLWNNFAVCITETKIFLRQPLSQVGTEFFMKSFNFEHFLVPESQILEWENSPSFSSDPTVSTP